MNIEDRQFLTEQIGEKWDDLSCVLNCSHIKVQINREKIFEFEQHKNRTFDTWEDFGACWEWASKQNLWSEFYYEKLCSPCLWHSGILEFNPQTINPATFCQSLVDFLRKME
jgi:hypothetical protein